MNKFKTLNFFGGCYVIFAFATAMVALQESDASTPGEAQVVADTSESNPVSSERLYQSNKNSRKDVWLTIWVTRNCYACELQKAEVPALEKAGYNVVLRRAPAPRWVRMFPTTVATHRSPTGPRIASFAGFRTLAEIDALLKIGDKEEEEEEKEIPDYDITQAQISIVLVWLDESTTSDAQRDELRRLPRGVTLLVFSTTRHTPPEDICDFPQTLIIQPGSKGGTSIKYLTGLHTAEEIMGAM